MKPLDGNTNIRHQRPTRQRSESVGLSVGVMRVLQVKILHCSKRTGGHDCQSFGFLCHLSCTLSSSSSAFTIVLVYMMMKSQLLFPLMTRKQYPARCARSLVETTLCVVLLHWLYYTHTHTPIATVSSAPDIQTAA